MDRYSEKINKLKYIKDNDTESKYSLSEMLSYASYTNNMERVKNFIAKIEISAFERNNMGPAGYRFEWDDGLMGACAAGNTTIIDLMLDKGASDYNLGMCAAAFGGYIDIVESMISSGADDLCSCIFQTTKKGHYDIAKMIIDKNICNCHINSLGGDKRIICDTKINSVFSALTNNNGTIAELVYKTI